MNSNAKLDSASSSCPKPRELAAFDCGDLPATTAEQMTDHVQSCETCLVQHISSDDESDKVRRALTGTTAHAVDATRYMHEDEYVRLRNNLLVNPEPVADSSLLDDAMGPVRCVAVSPDGLLAVSGSSDGTLRVWQLAEWMAVRVSHGSHHPP